MASAAIEDRSTEFELSDRDFARIASVVRQETGIVLGPQKRNLVYGRLAKRLRAHRLDNFSDYLKIIEGPDRAQELREMLNAITTNLTAFFREAHHFDTLEQEVLPELMSGACAGRKLRLWSSACSSGEEPYSIAMVVDSLRPKFPGCDVKILATDIDTNMVDVAARGRYDGKRTETIPKKFKGRYCVPVEGDVCEMSGDLKSLIVFRELNLFNRWPMKGLLDVIFCRNVLIYFDKDAQNTLFERFADHMPLGGWLMIGHSETIPATCQRFSRVGRTVYRRVK
jgi:chemotaxis protein methyltransferase CheR